MPESDLLIQAVRRATRTLARTGSIDQLLQDVLRICVEAVGAAGGTIYVHDAASKRLTFQHVLPEWIREKLPMTDIADDFGAAGEAFQKREVITRSFEKKEESEYNDFERSTGVVVDSMMCVPLQMEDEEPLGVVQLVNKASGSFSETDIAVMDTVAAVCTMAVLNSRLIEQSTRSSSLLGMGKVSHDIGNLAASLFATIGYGEHVVEGLKSAHADKDQEMVELQVDSMDGLFGEVKVSVDRIVGYSRLISDLSAGRELRPEFKPGSLADTVTMAAAYLETEARRNRVEIQYDIERAAPEHVFDELFVFRIVQNMVGNAIKAVRETLPDDLPPLNDLNPDYLGRVAICYGWKDDCHRIEVRDSGPGMTRQVADRILSGNARSQWGKGGGSGWGTKIILELTAAHGGTVEVESTPGEGATFIVKLPARADTKTV